MIPKDEIDRVCEECGLIHAGGISRHGRCYNCGGELALVDLEELRLTAVTPKGIQIFENINTKTK